VWRKILELSVGGQGESNPAPRLATRAGKMELSCPLGAPRSVPQKIFPETHIINPLLTKLVRSRWLVIVAYLLFCVFMDHYNIARRAAQSNSVMIRKRAQNPDSAR